MARFKAVGRVRGSKMHVENSYPYGSNVSYRLLISCCELKICFVKAIGGVQGFFCMLGSYESAAIYGTSAFYCNSQNEH